jgi:hypothetical protein
MGICAMNAVVPTHLAIVDGLEGGNGRGDFIRLDTLIAGTNPVATDTVACRLAGVTAIEHRQFQLAAEYGLGPCTMDQIEVMGVPLEDASFRLARLNDNVLEMPVAFCLNLLSTGELRQVQRALPLYGLVDAALPETAGRGDLLAQLEAVLSSEGYYERALAACTEYARALARILVERGGTSGSLVDVQRAFGEAHPGLYYYPSHRVLMRLGLAYPVESATRPYYLLPEGLVEILSRYGRRVQSAQSPVAISAG